MGKDAASDPEYLLEKLGGFDFGSMGGEDAASKKSIDALSKLKMALAKVTIACPCREQGREVGYLVYFPRNDSILLSESHCSFAVLVQNWW